MPRETVADRLIESDVVVFARENPDKPFSYQAVDVLKGKCDSIDIDLFLNSSTRRQLKVNEDLVVVLVRGGENRSWRTVGVADRVYQQVVRRVLAFAPQWRGKGGAEKRCEFFLMLFGHENRALFRLAYLEMGRAPYSTIKRLGGIVPKEDILPFLQRREYIEWRALAILMLTQNANESDRKLIESRFDDCCRFALTTNLAAWATAYIELRGASAIDRIQQQYLSNPDRTEEEIRGVITALSVHGRDGHTHLRDQIARSYAIAMKNHPAVADAMRKDLADWAEADETAPNAPVSGDGKPT